MLTNVYGPCRPDAKADFISWFREIQMPNETCWLALGDFNFIRSPSDRNQPGGMSMKYSSLMKLLVNWDLWNFLSRGGHLLGVISNILF